MEKLKLTPTLITRPKAPKKSDMTFTEHDELLKMKGQKPSTNEEKPIDAQVKDFVTLHDVFQNLDDTMAEFEKMGLTTPEEFEDALKNNWKAIKGEYDKVTKPYVKLPDETEKELSKLVLRGLSLAEEASKKWPDNKNLERKRLALQGLRAQSGIDITKLNSKK